MAASKLTRAAVAALLLVPLVAASSMVLDPADASLPPEPVTDYAAYPGLDALAPGCEAEAADLLADPSVAVTAPGSERHDVGDLASVDPAALQPGAAIELAWSGVAEGCEQVEVSLALSSATADPALGAGAFALDAFDHCGPASGPCEPGDDGLHRLSVTVPEPATEGPAPCRRLDVVTGAPLAVLSTAVDPATGEPLGSDYDAEVRAAHPTLADGPSTSISSSGPLGCAAPAPAAAEPAPELDPPVEAGPVAVHDDAVELVSVAQSGPCGPYDGCPEVLSFAVECAEGAVAVLLTNSGGQDAEVLVGAIDVVVPAGTAAGDPVRVAVPVAEGESFAIPVTSGGQTLDTLEGVVDCASADVLGASLECAAGGYVITVGNGGTGSGPVEVLKDGQLVESANLPAGGQAEVLVPFEEGETATVVVRQPGQDDQTLFLTRDCEQPNAVITFACDTGVVVTAGNSGQAAAEVQVLRDGAAVDTLTVAPGATEMRSYELTPTERVTFEVRSRGELIAGPADIQEDCPRPVVPAVPVGPDAPGGAVTITADGTPVGGDLARTGSETSVLLVAAGILLMVGGGFLVLSQRDALVPIRARA